MDYQGNTNKAKEPIVTPAIPEKNIEKVVTGEVITRKKPLGKKFKDVFIGADFKSVVLYVCTDVLVPAARNLVVDASTKGIERLMYGNDAVRRRDTGPATTSRVVYQTPVRRSSQPPRTYDTRGRPAPPTRLVQEEIILSTREEAETVLERMNDIVTTFGAASRADLNELLGRPAPHTDNKWGWDYVIDVPIQQIREGYLIDFPAAEPLP